MQFRLREAQVAVHHAEHRTLACSLFKFRHEVAQHFDIRGLQHELHRETAALRTDALRFKHHHAQIRIFVTEHLNCTGDFALRTARFLVVVQEQTHSRVAGVPCSRLEFRIFVRIQDRNHLVSKLVRHAFRSCQVHAFGHAHVHHDRIRVFGRRHFATHVVKAIVRRKEKHRHNREQKQAHPEESAQQARIESIKPIEERFRDAEEPSLFLAFQEFRTKHRRKSERTKRRKEHSPDHHRHKFAEQEPSRTSQRKHRHEHGHQHDRCRNHRKKDFVGSSHGRLLGRHPVFNLVVNVFHNHNRIIHDKPNRKDHRQERKHVDTEPAKIKHKEATDNRHRHHDHRDKRRAAFAEERKDNRNHEHERNKDGLHHFLDGGSDINRSITTVKQFHAFRDFATDILHALVKLVCNFNVVTARLRHERKRNRVLAVAPKARTRILRFVMDICHIGNTDNSSIGGRLDGDIAERFGVEDSPKRTDRKSRFSSFDGTGREFEVALLQCRRHLCARNAQRLHADGVNPQAHYRTLFAPDSHFGNAVDCLQAFLHMVVRDFRDFHRVELVAHEAHHQNRVVIAIGLINSRFIDIIGQATAHTAHAVTDFVCSRFQVHARFKFNADIGEPVTTRRRQRLDAGRTVDGGFKNFGYFRFDNGSVRARIRRTHLNQRIIDVRVFTNAQRSESEKTEQNNDKRHHSHQNRAANRELTYAHYSTS